MITGKLQKERMFLILFAAACLGAVWFSWDRLMADGLLTWHMEQAEYGEMAKETGVLFCLFLLIWTVAGKRRIAGGLSAAAAFVFCWAHQIALPLAVSGIYLLYIGELGRRLRTMVFRLPDSDGAAADFLAGSCSLICLFCLMSLGGIGAIPWLQGFSLVTGMLLVGARLAEKRNRYHAGREEGRLSFAFCFSMAVIFTMVCLQAGRMNIALDFDSLWYGVRAPYILDNGRGFYENLGTIGIVYTYSKGFEILTLPLSGLPSYSFLISFNLWLAAGILALAYSMARHFMSRELAVFLSAFLSAVPGIMNMTVTAKTDIATLMFQVVMLFYMIRYLAEGKEQFRYLFYSSAAFFLTWTLKPTAMVFSTAVLGMSGLFLIVRGQLPTWRLKELAGSFLMLALSLGALAGVWARTIIITGLPVTSVFSSILTKLGFEMKYPFNVNKLPNNGAYVEAGDQISFFLKRLFCFFFLPEGVDMEHVILAWGGFVLAILFFLWIYLKVCEKNGGRQENTLFSGYFKTVFIPFLLVNLVSLYMLVQVDGNYFMLLYFLSAFLGFYGLSQVKSRFTRRGVCIILLPVLGFLVLSTSLTNWSWTIGYSPISWNHMGYYNHMEAEKAKMEASGNGQIWDILAEDPRNRLIAIGPHPDILSFPCSAQSYDDVTGTWGNVVLVKKMDYFVEFMDYAQTDYIYAKAGYMGEEERCYTLVRDLIEYGKLVPVCYENGNMLAKVDIDGEYDQESQAALTEFYKCYIKKDVENTGGESE